MCKTPHFWHFNAKMKEVMFNRKIIEELKVWCLIREKVVTFRMVKLNLLLSIFCITK